MVIGLLSANPDSWTGSDHLVEPPKDIFIETGEIRSCQEVIVIVEAEPLVELDMRNSGGNAEVHQCGAYVGVVLDIVDHDAALVNLLEILDHSPGIFFRYCGLRRRKELFDDRLERSPLELRIVLCVPTPVIQTQLVGENLFRRLVEDHIAVTPHSEMLLFHLLEPRKCTALAAKRLALGVDLGLWRCDVILAMTHEEADLISELELSSVLVKPDEDGSRTLPNYLHGIHCSVNLCFDDMTVES